MFPFEMLFDRSIVRSDQTLPIMHTRYTDQVIARMFRLFRLFRCVTDGNGDIIDYISTRLTP